jgi:hypothetical protein
VKLYPLSGEHSYFKKPVLDCCVITVYTLSVWGKIGEGVGVGTSGCGRSVARGTEGACPINFLWIPQKFLLRQ